MGQYSWSDAKTKKNIEVGQKCYALIPKEYDGGYYEESYYNGCENFDGHDIFEEVALWNRDYLCEDNLMPEPSYSEFGGLQGDEAENLKKKGFSDAEIEALDQIQRFSNFDREKRRRQLSVQRLKDFTNYTDDVVMRVLYGKDYLREIGLDITAYDEQNKNLKYPIKITREPAKYERVKRFSKYVPAQE